MAQSPDLSAASVPSVIKVNRQIDSRWEEFVSAHPDALIYHHPAWLKVLEEAYGYEPVNLVCEGPGGQLRGVLPLSYTRGLVTGRRLVSLPHTPMAGPLGLDNQANAALMRAAITWAERKLGTQLQIRMPSPSLDGVVDGLVKISQETTYTLQLPAHPEELRFGNPRNHARIKWAVNKATKLGVRTRLATTECELRAWYRLYLDTLRWHATPPRPYRFFKLLWETLHPRGLMCLMLAEQHEVGRSRLLAGSVFLMFGETVFYAYNGRCRKALSLRPNDVIQWHAIQEACRAGFRRYDFGEVPENNQGLTAFKLKWGANPEQLYRYHYPTPRERGTYAYRGNIYNYRFANAAWRCLPLRVTELLGTWLYGHL